MSLVKNERAKHDACVPQQDFGCIRGGHGQVDMWARRCRGIFFCDGQEVTCGHAGMKDKVTCSCLPRPAIDCQGTFIDVGANRGDSLHKWYSQKSCAIGPHQVRGKNESCAWEFPWWLPLPVRQTYCAQVYEPNPVFASSIAHVAAKFRLRLGVRIDVYNTTALGEADGEALFGIDQNNSNAAGSSLMLNRRAFMPRPPCRHNTEMASHSLLWAK